MSAHISELAIKFMVRLIDFIFGAPYPGRCMFWDMDQVAGTILGDDGHG